MTNESRVVVENENFESEDELRNYWTITESLGRLIFLNSSFKTMNWTGYVFGSCDFKNCTFTKLAGRKMIFSGCYFENCKFNDSDFLKTEFYKIHFKNCEFSNVNLMGSDFDNCKLEKTKFSGTNLDDTIIISDVRVWKSNEWISINDFSILKENFSEDS